ncbi:hypothetical protein JTE88_03620 [Arcanobacterium phocisimile]|uniref:ABC-2 type transport system permease protein n=1 Tax=Arcanobacterium phocisimile TaxID=1302235 RepID=A0ABX7II54_9ACTO|nr:hypothetical protein [Arcanobacterium phocisimile]QRV02824.1 hypothetical protein JTE88_03620 [Arcanobacterium phocisimile]
MRGVATYFTAFRTLPSGLAALVFPLLTVPVFKILVVLGAEINGSVVSGSASSQLSMLGSLVLLCSAWIAGVLLNHYDVEINKLMMRSHTVNGLVTHLLLGIIWFAGTLLLLAVFDIGVFKELDGWSVAIALTEVMLLSLLGCAIGFAFKSGVFSVSFIILYSLLLAPAIYRLIPAITERGIAPRLAEISNGQEGSLPLLFDIVYFTLLIAAFLGIYFLGDKLYVGNKDGHKR